MRGYRRPVIRRRSRWVPGRAAVRRAPGWLPRAVLVLALLGVAFVPVSGTVAGQQAIGCRVPACRQPVNAQRWVTPLQGDWAVGGGATGTYPVSGQAYAAAGDGVAAIGYGLTISAYALRDGSPLWQLNLPGFKPGSAIMSVRAWPGVVTVGVAAPSGTGRTEVVIDSVTGVALRQYPAALFGGAVLASTATTVIIGASSVTSYANGSGKVRWRLKADARQAWRADEHTHTLYLTESAGGYLQGAPVTGLQVINLNSGAERTLGSPTTNPFTGSLAEVVPGVPSVVLFTTASGVTAYNASTGGMLWSMHAVVPEGTDPAEGLVYLTSASGALLGVDPATGQVRRSVSGATAPGSAGMYVVRDGVALGLDRGASGEAWGYSLTAGRVTWTAPGLPWPHYFADVSGIGGSAAATDDAATYDPATDDIVVIVACRRLAPPAPPTLTPGSATAATTAPSGTTTAPSGLPGAPASGTGSRAASPDATGTATSPVHGPAGPSTGGTPTPAPTASGSPSATPSPPQMCAAPVLVALAI